MRRVVLTLAAVFAAGPVGCGTVFVNAPHNLGETLPRGAVYGGVRLDVELARSAVADACDQNDNPRPRDRWSLAFWTCGQTAADLPLSFAADTVLLPVTVPTALARQWGKREPAPEPTDPSAKPCSPP
jgi:uncharacterized protein YceK